MAQTFVAIDLSPERARLAVIEATLRTSELTRLETFARLPEETEAELLVRVRAVLPQELDSIVVSCDPTATSARRLEFPFSDVRKIEAAIDFELEGQVPYDLDDLSTAWIASNKSAAQTSVLSAITPRANLLQRIELFSTAEFEPRAVVLPAAVLTELAPSDEEITGILCVGETMSHLTLAEKGQLRFLRSIRAGGADIDRVIAKRFNLSLEDAKVAKERDARIVGKNETDEQLVRVSDAVRDGLRSVLTNLMATLHALPADERPGRLLLTGGTSRLPGLRELLQTALGVEVELLDINAAMAPVTMKTPSLGPEYAVVVAMALATLRRGRAIALNLRRGDLAYKGDLQLYRGQLMRLAVGAAAVFLLAIVAATVRYTVITSEERQLNRGFCEVTQRIIGKEICDPTAALATMRHSPGSTEGVVIPAYSASTVLEMMSKILSTEVDVTFEDMEIRLDNRAGESDRITAKGDAASFETTEQVVAMLKKEPCVQEADISKQQKARNSSRVEFNLTIQLQCPAGEQPGGSAKVAQALESGE